MVTPGLLTSTSSVAGAWAWTAPARASRQAATRANQAVDRRGVSENLRMGPLAPDRGLGPRRQDGGEAGWNRISEGDGATWLRHPAPAVIGRGAGRSNRGCSST